MAIDGAGGGITPPTFKSINQREDELAADLVKAGGPNDPDREAAIAKLENDKTVTTQGIQEAYKDRPAHDVNIATTAYNQDGDNQFSEDEFNDISAMLMNPNQAGYQATIHQAYQQGLGRPEGADGQGMAQWARRAQELEEGGLKPEEVKSSLKLEIEAANKSKPATTAPPASYAASPGASTGQTPPTTTPPATYAASPGASTSPPASYAASPGASTGHTPPSTNPPASYAGASAGSAAHSGPDPSCDPVAKGEHAAVKAAMREAKTPEAFKALADRLPADDHRKPVLNLMADPAVSPKVRDQARKAIEDGENTYNDVRSGLAEAKTPQDFALLAATAKVNPETAPHAAAIAAIGTADNDQVRSALREAYLNPGAPDGSFSAAMMAAKTPADFAAIQTVMGAETVKESKPFAQLLAAQLNGSTPARRAELAAGAEKAGDAKLAEAIRSADKSSSTEVRDKLLHALQDDTQTGGDFDSAKKAARTPEDWAAIASAYEAKGNPQAAEEARRSALALRR